MSIKNWAAATAIVEALKFVNKGGKIKELSDSVDQALDKNFPKRSEKIQTKMVEHVLLPLAYHLMIDASPFTLQKLLIDMNTKIGKVKGGK